MAPNRTAGIVLCAGRGTRMGSRTLNKVCFPVAGEPAINRILRTYRGCGIDPIVVVVGAMAGRTIEIVGRAHPEVLFAYQREQLGTGHAAQVGFRALRRCGWRGHVLVALGDKLVDESVVEAVKGAFARSRPDALVTVSRRRDKGRQGRVVIDRTGTVEGIWEWADIRAAAIYSEALAMTRHGPVSSARLRRMALTQIPEESRLSKAIGPLWSLLQRQRRIDRAALEGCIPPGAGRIVVAGRPRTARQVERMGRWVNESVYLFKASALRCALDELLPRPAGSELYLPDAINRLAARGRRVQALVLRNADLVLGFNSPEELAQAEERLLAAQEHRTHRDSTG